jgi:class 3 adenylate cyclase
LSNDGAGGILYRIRDTHGRAERVMPELPTGAVTLLFTDIEGSTRLLNALGEHERYPEALARHRDIVRAAIECEGGIEVDTQGDAFFVAFPAVSGALAAASRIQEELAAFPWPNDLGIRLRIGNHTGAPVRTSEGYVGLDVHRAARICAAGHGGQVLVSARAAEAGADVLPAGVTLRDLGEHRLKDLPRPERLYQLVIPGLPSEFPPLRVPSSHDAHYDTITKGLGDGRIVLFLGMGVNLCGRPPSRSWQPGRLDCLPSEQELAACLAHSFDYPAAEPVDLVRVSQYVAVTAGLGPLYEELHTLLDADFAPTPLHHLIASLPARLRAAGSARPYQLVVTTTYDDVLERAFRFAGEPFDLVTYVAEGEHRGRFLHWAADGTARVIDRPNEYLGLSLDQRTVILKIHGAVDRATAEWDSFVVTEDHYIDYLARTDISNMLPVTLAARLRRSHYLFLGYRLRDWNLRVILHRIWGQQKLTYKSWAIDPRPHAIDQSFWQKREVDVLDVSLDDYVTAVNERVSAQAPP